jgi:hypothetical protein
MVARPDLNATLTAAKVLVDLPREGGVEAYMKGTHGGYA